MRRAPKPVSVMRRRSPGLMKAASGSSHRLGKRCCWAPEAALAPAMTEANLRRNRASTNCQRWHRDVSNVRGPSATLSNPQQPSASAGTLSTQLSLISKSAPKQWRGAFACGARCAVRHSLESAPSHQAEAQSRAAGRARCHPTFPKPTRPNRLDPHCEVGRAPLPPPVYTMGGSKS